MEILDFDTLPQETFVICVIYTKLQVEYENDGMQSLVDACTYQLDQIKEPFFEHLNEYTELMRSFSSIPKSHDCRLEAMSIMDEFRVNQIITQDHFNRSAKNLIKKNLATSLEDIASILQLMYLVAKECGLQNVVDIAVMSLVLCGQNILQGGWLHLTEYSVLDTSLSSSIVLVPEQVKTSAAQIDNNNYTSIQPFDEEYESMDSATPPEIIEKPAYPSMTADSIIKLMDGDASPSSRYDSSPDTPVNTPNLPITSDDDGTSRSSPHMFESEILQMEELNQRLEETQNSESSRRNSRNNEAGGVCEKEEDVKIEQEVAQEEEEVVHEVVQEKAIVKEVVEEEKKVSDSSSSSFLPSLSTGVVAVAAAAACIGLFMMKK